MATVDDLRHFPTVLQRIEKHEVWKIGAGRYFENVDLGEESYNFRDFMQGAADAKQLISDGSVPAPTTDTECVRLLIKVWRSHARAGRLSRDLAGYLAPDCVFQTVP